MPGLIHNRRVTLAPGPTRPEKVQEVGQSETGVTTSSATFLSTTKNGNGIVVGFAIKNGARVSTLVDNKGNTFIFIGFAADQTNTVVELWYAQGITGGSSHQLTATFSASTNVVWGAVEITKVKNGGMLDGPTPATAVRNGAGSSASFSVTSGRPSQTNDVFIAFLALGGGGANAGITTPSGFTQFALFNDYDGSMAGHGATRVQAQRQAVTATWSTGTTTAPCAAIIAGFKAASALPTTIAKPVNTAPPSITGTPTEGETLTRVVGSYSNSPTSYSYQWNADGVAISGAVGTSYVLTASEVGAEITVTEIAYNAGGASTPTTSAAVGPVATAFSPILDDLSTSASGAWSTYRRLRTGYASNLIRVRRSSDDTEQDIGYTASGLLDTTALLAFCGAGNGFLTKIYDQSGNGYDFVQATAANQPQIVSSGSVITSINSKACAQFDGTDDYMATAADMDTIISRTANALFGIARPTAQDSGEALYGTFDIYARPAIAGGYSSGNLAFAGFSPTGPAVQFYSYAGVQTGVEVAQSAPPYTAVFTMVKRPTGSLHGYVNGGTGASDSTIGDRSAASAGTKLGLGGHYVGVDSNYYTGFIQELIAFSSVPSAADLNTLGFDQASVAGTTWTDINVGQIENETGSATIMASVARRLSSGYTTGNLIRVRRSSDNAEQDIGQSSGLLDTTALTAFVGAGNGFVVTIYDQSGRGNHLTNSTASEQPKIVNAGTIYTDINGKPCMLFDGVDDRLMTAADLTSIIDQTDYTIYATVRPTSGGTNDDSNPADNPNILGGDPYGYLNIAVKDDPGLTFFQWVGSAKSVSVSSDAFPYTGVVAMRLSGGVLRGFINGGSGGTLGSAGTQGSNAGNKFSVGSADQFGNTSHYAGYGQEYVVYDNDLSVTDFNTVGSNLATFAGKTWTSDPYFENVVLLASFDGADAATAAFDESPTTPHTLTFNGNAQLDTAQKKFGSASLLLDGTGDYVSLTDNTDFTFGADPFTVECWFRNNGDTEATLVSHWFDGANRAWTLNLTTFGLEFFWYVGGVQRTTQYTGWQPTPGVQHHCVVERDASGIVRLYVDGVMGQKHTGITGAIDTTTAGLTIGRTTGLTTIDTNGWIDEVRITKGVARYASDAGYTVPTTAFPRT